MLREARIEVQALIKEIRQELRAEVGEDKRQRAFDRAYKALSKPATPWWQKK